jgi:hypothetical protein
VLSHDSQAWKQFWGRDGDEQLTSSNDSVRPGVVRPSTVLVTELGVDSFLVQSYPTGSSAYICVADGEPMRKALNDAFAGNGMPIEVPRP